MKKILSLLLVACLLASCTQVKQPRYAPVVTETTASSPSELRAETNALAAALQEPVKEETVSVPPVPTNQVAQATPAVEKHVPAQTNAVPSPFAHPAQPAIPAETSPTAESAIPIETTNTTAETPLPAHSINFQGVPVKDMLEVYAQYVGRTLLQSPAIPGATQITLVQQTPLTRTELIHAMDSVLAMNNIAMIPIGDKFIKVVPLAEAGSVGHRIDEGNPAYLPEIGPFDSRIVQLKYLKPTDMVAVLGQFTKTPGAVMPIEGAGMLVLRDSAENMRIMLQIIKMLDTSVPESIESEVIPIKYALASDIANALNSLSGSGGGVTTTAHGISRSTGLGTHPLGTQTGYGGGIGGQGAVTPGGLGGFGGNAAGATGGAASQSFAQRVQGLVQAANTAGGGGKGEFQILGQTKIIADERMNALLVFAAHEDMVRIKDLVKKLDVVLPQVLIEAIIMEVTIDKAKNLGVSFAQEPMGNHNQTAGGFNNGQQFFPFTLGQQGGSNAFPGNFSSTLPANMFSYWANFNGNYDLAVQAAMNDSRVNVLSRPRIQTSHGVEADLFVGETIPYVDSTTAGAFGGTGVYNSYQQQQIGITLKVKPLINPDGLVVMDIYQEASEPGPSSTAVDINGTSVPTINQRQASATVAVKDRDTIILGGMIGTTVTKTISGVPYLMNIPMLGKLFQSSADTTERTELIVLLRPTVLPTPEAAATVASAERKAMAGVRLGEAEIRSQEAVSMKQAEDAIKHMTNGMAPPEY